MKVVNRIPKEIAQIYLDYPQIGRRTLIQKHGLSTHEARIFSWMMKNGKVIYHHDLATQPEDGGTKKAAILPDIHFPYHDERALDIAINYVLKVGVDVVIVPGDGVDCYQISYWKTDPLRDPFHVEVRKSIKFIKYLTEVFPDDTEKIWIEGNHELRLRNMLWSKAREFAGLPGMDIPTIYEISKHGWNYVSNFQLMQSGLPPFAIGKLFVLHGQEIKISGGAVNLAKLHYDKNPVTQINTHHHQSQEYIISKMDLQVDGSWTTGCLCDLHPDYAPANRWNHGLAIVEYDSSGYFSVMNKKIISGRVL